MTAMTTAMTMTMTTARTDLGRLDPASAAAGLRAAGEAGRGFLGLDPVTQNDTLLVNELSRLGAQVFGSERALLGYLTNPDQPRQAVVATTSADPEPLRAFLAFLGTYQRCSSFVAFAPDGAAMAAALAACGFAERGTLRAHRYQSGRYLDVSIYYARLEDVCPS